MCGIAGIINSRESFEESKRELSNMLGAIRHRGPDATGIYNSGNNFLGHNRLSIIDLDARPIFY